MPRPVRYAFSIPIRVAFGDMDALGHVNNVTYARYFETARAEFIISLGETHHLKRPDGAVMIMTRLELDYRGETVFPAILEVTVGIAEVTMRKLVLCCTMWNARGDCVAEGRSHHLWIDLKKRGAIRMPEDFRAVIEKLTGAKNPD